MPNIYDTLISRMVDPNRSAPGAAGQRSSGNRGPADPIYSGATVNLMEAQEFRRDSDQAIDFNSYRGSRKDPKKEKACAKEVFTRLNTLLNDPAKTIDADARAELTSYARDLGLKYGFIRPNPAVAAHGGQNSFE